MYTKEQIEREWVELKKSCSIYGKLLEKMNKYMTMQEFHELCSKKNIGFIKMNIDCPVCSGLGLITCYEKMAIVKCPKCNEEEEVKE